MMQIEMRMDGRLRAKKTGTLKKSVGAGASGVATLWRRNFAKFHFLNQARSRYGYAPRHGERGHPAAFERTVTDKQTGKRKRRLSYTARKLKQKGHTKPTKFHNKLEPIVLYTGPITVKSEGSITTAAIELGSGANNFKLNKKLTGKPTKVNKTEGDPGKPNTVLEELHRLAPGEQTALDRKFVQVFEKSFRSIGKRRTVTKLFM